LIIVFAGVHGLQSQEKPESKVLIENADNQLTEIVDDSYIHFLKGNVRVIQDSIFMFCDTARLSENKLAAKGNVVILQGDSINVFSDSLYYSGDSKLAQLFINVVLENGAKRIFSNRLIYDLDAKMALIPDTCLFTNNGLKLNSLSARYDVDRELAFFYGEVTALDENLKLKSDSLMYDAENDRIYFIAPTYMEQAGGKIFCKDGFYDVAAQRAFFSEDPVFFDDSLYARSHDMYYDGIDSITVLSGEVFMRDSSSQAYGDVITMDDKTQDVILDGNASYRQGDRLIEGPLIVYNRLTKDVKLNGRSRISSADGYIEGDTISYEDKADRGVIQGRPFWRDTVENRIIEGGLFNYREKQKYFKAMVLENSRPVVKQLVDRDTFYISADTLISAQDHDSIPFMEAVRNVKMFKSDFQAVCDSLYYSERDSVFLLFGNPVVWSDTTQFTGDTLAIQMEDDMVSEIVSMTDAFIISEDAFDLYNQIKGQRVHAILDSNKLRRMDVTGNAQSLYFIKDEEDAYVGPVITNCTKMSYYFENDSLQEVRYYSENESELIPMKLAQKSDFRLDNFQWQSSRRPMRWRDILVVDRSVPIVRFSIQDAGQGDEFQRAVDGVMKDRPKGKTGEVPSPRDIKTNIKGSRKQ